MDEQNKREKAISDVKEAWGVLVRAVKEYPGELEDVAHVRMVDGEGEQVDAAVAVIRKGRVSRVAAQGLGDGFECACSMLAQVLLLRASLLRSSYADDVPDSGRVERSGY